MMNQNDFTIVLPSNSSLKYFPNNATTNYSTRLPHEVQLIGKWVVGISEIHIPCSTLHLRVKDTIITDYKGSKGVNSFQHGTYNSMHSLVHAINDGLLKFHENEACEKLSYNEKGGYVYLKQFQNKKEAEFTDNVKRILGFENGIYTIYNTAQQNETNYTGLTLVGDQPASLSRAIPDQLFVYSNLCEPSIVGDTHAPLLRIVNIEANKFNFGSTIVKRFTPVNYVPLLNNRFQIVDIDIRDQFGKPIAFEFGTVTVALHFKREY